MSERIVIPKIMKINYRIVVLIAMYPLLSTAISDNKNTFHLPLTSAEKKLDKIITTVERDANFSHYLLQTPFYDQAKNINYNKLVTKELAVAYSEAERMSVQINCQGRYANDLVCGIIDQPITCSPDGFEQPYLYRTLQQTPDMAIIEYACPQVEGCKEEVKPAILKMVKQEDNWLVDGVHCTGAYLETRYNMN